MHRPYASAVQQASSYCQEWHAGQYILVVPYDQSSEAGSPLVGIYAISGQPIHNLFGRLGDLISCQVIRASLSCSLPALKLATMA